MVSTQCPQDTAHNAESRTSLTQEERILKRSSANKRALQTTSSPALCWHRTPMRSAQTEEKRSFFGWGDIYSDGKKGDYDKAKELYVKALAIAKEKSDIEAVRDRLEDVETRDRT